MQIQVRLFAIHRERMGRDVISIELNDQATLADLVTAMGERYPELAPLLQAARFAVNREYAPMTRALQPGDEVAFIPPVAGGDVS